MQVRRLFILIGFLCAALGWLTSHLAFPTETASAQPAASAQAGSPASTPAQAPQQTTPSEASNETFPTIKAETRLVLVDSVVTDKKGNYVRDLTAKDFRVWEDNKEKPITSFSFGVDPASPERSQQKYLVLFFDNSTMDFGDQAKARQAAGQFIDANAAPNRPMAIVDFGGSIVVAQNFTSDADRLKKVVAGIRTSSVSPNAPPVEVASLGMTSIGAPSLGNAESDFGVRSVMLAVRSLAKSLSTVPGRKTLVMLTSGFLLTPEVQSELTAVIDECNKANVAIYPIDVRGLVTPNMGGAAVGGPSAALHSPPSPQSAHLASAVYSDSGSGLPGHLLFHPAAWIQHSGGGGGGGGGHGGTGGSGSGSGSGSGGGHGGTSGGRGGTAGGSGTSGGRSGTSPGQFSGASPYSMPRQIVPAFPASASDNQQVLYQLASGTGGFVIVNTNDLLGGLEKIGKEQSEYYIVGYSPDESPEGSCHTLKLKVNRGGTIVRSRSGYCNVRPRDLLAGNSIEKGLESHASADMPGNVTGVVQAPFFYISPNTARVNLALEIPSGSLKFEKVKGKMHSAVNVLGIAYKPDNTIAARFSDTVNLDFQDKHELEEFTKDAFHYENEFEISSGVFLLKVVFSSGNQSFGKLEKQLVIDAYDGKQFAMSGLALSNQIHRISENESGLDAALLEDKTLLVVRGMQITPSASNRFKKTDPVAIYAEVYEPLLTGPKPPTVGLELIVVDRKSGTKKVDIGVPNTDSSIEKGSSVIPVGLKLPIDSLASGSYQLQLKALDSVGNSSSVRSCDFEVE
jgi:VWFA-related protein